MAISFKLSRLYNGWEKDPVLFRRYYNDAMSEIEGALKQLLSLEVIQDAIEDLEEVSDDLTAATAAAQTAADDAQAAADAANTAATQVTGENSVVNSYIDNTSFTAPLISCSDTGSVVIADHTRVLGNGDTISVTGATIASGGVSGEVLRYYYDSTERTDGAAIAPSFLSTTDPAAPPVQGGDRFSVGAVTVPVTGTNDGKYVTPPGFIEP